MAGKESTDLSAGVKFERETEAHKERLAEVAEGTLLAQACSPEDVADAVMSFIVFNRECDFLLATRAGGCSSDRLRAQGSSLAKF